MSCGISSSFGLTKSKKQKQRESAEKKQEAISSLMYELDELEWRINGFSCLTEKQRIKLHEEREPIFEVLQNLRAEVLQE